MRDNSGYIGIQKRKNGAFYISGVDSIGIGIAGKAINRIDYLRDNDVIRKDEKILLQAITGIAKKNILMLNQIHGDRIIILDTLPDNNEVYYDHADGIVTNIPELCIVIRTADCVPVFAFDNQKKVFGAVHSGWRGCRLSISRKLIRIMRDTFSSDCRDIQIFILPSIGPFSYVVNDDVATFFIKYINIRDNRKYLDLWTAIESSLIEEKILKQNIFNSMICTKQKSNQFFSYRNCDTGRNLNFGYIIK